jgi:hypothetical protein
LDVYHGLFQEQMISIPFLERNTRRPRQIFFVEVLDSISLRSVVSTDNRQRAQFVAASLDSLKKLFVLRMGVESEATINEILEDYVFRTFLFDPFDFSAWSHYSAESGIYIVVVYVALL